MPISVKDIKEKDFTAQKHGYAIEEVDDFLDEIAEQVSEIIKENLLLKDKLAKVESAPPPAPVVIQKESAKPDIDDEGYFKNLESAMRDSLINAQRIAEETKKKADKEAQDAVSNARAKAEAMMAEAKAEVDAMKAEAQSVRDAIAKYRGDFRALIEEQIKVLKTRESLFD